jgi:hypothetical protein
VSIHRSKQYEVPVKGMRGAEVHSTDCLCGAGTRGKNNGKARLDAEHPPFRLPRTGKGQAGLWGDSPPFDPFPLLLWGSNWQALPAEPSPPSLWAGPVPVFPQSESRLPFALRCVAAARSEYRLCGLGAGPLGLPPPSPWTEDWTWSLARHGRRSQCSGITRPCPRPVKGQTPRLSPLSSALCPLLSHSLFYHPNSSHNSRPPRSRSW